MLVVPADLACCAALPDTLIRPGPVAVTHSSTRTCYECAHIRVRIVSKLQACGSACLGQLAAHCAMSVSVNALAVLD